MADNPPVFTNIGQQQMQLGANIASYILPPDLSNAATGALAPIATSEGRQDILKNIESGLWNAAGVLIGVLLIIAGIYLLSSEFGGIPKASGGDSSPVPKRKRSESVDATPEQQARFNRGVERIHRRNESRARKIERSERARRRDVYGKDATG
jgi:hypothetical protein